MGIKMLFIAVLLFVAAVANAQENMWHFDSTWLSKYEWRADTAYFYLTYVDTLGYVRADSCIRIRSGMGNEYTWGYYDDPHLKITWFHRDWRPLATKWLLSIWE